MDGNHRYFETAQGYEFLTHETFSRHHANFTSAALSTEGLVKEEDHRYLCVRAVDLVVDR